MTGGIPPNQREPGGHQAGMILPEGEARDMGRMDLLKGYPPTTVTWTLRNRGAQDEFPLGLFSGSTSTWLYKGSNPA